MLALAGLPCKSVDEYGSKHARERRVCHEPVLVAADHQSVVVPCT